MRGQSERADAAGGGADEDRQGALVFVVHQGQRQEELTPGRRRS